MPSRQYFVSADAARVGKMKTGANTRRLRSDRRSGHLHPSFHSLEAAQIPLFASPDTPMVLELPGPRKLIHEISIQQTLSNLIPSVADTNHDPSIGNSGTTPGSVSMSHSYCIVDAMDPTTLSKTRGLSNTLLICVSDIELHSVVLRWAFCRSRRKRDTNMEVILACGPLFR